MVAGTATNNFLDFSATRLVAISLIDADRGNDEVIGSVFADTIQGGSGHDTLTGGGGIDTAVFSGSIDDRSEEHTSELQSLMRISYAVFCLKKKNKHPHTYRPSS